MAELNPKNNIINWAIIISLVLISGTLWLITADLILRQGMDVPTDHLLTTKAQTFPQVLGYKHLTDDVTSNYSDRVRPGDGTPLGVDFKLDRDSGAKLPESWFFGKGATAICKLISPDATSFVGNAVLYPVGRSEMILHCSWGVVPAHEGLHQLFVKAVFRSEYAFEPLHKRPKVVQALPQQIPIFLSAPLSVREPIFTLDHVVAVLGAAGALIAGFVSILIALIARNSERPLK
jgi:hypothetical protein